MGNGKNKFLFNYGQYLVLVLGCMLLFSAFEVAKTSNWAILPFMVSLILLGVWIGYMMQ